MKGRVLYRRRMSTRAAVGVVALGLFAACGGGAPPPAAMAPTPATPSASAANEGPQEAPEPTPSAYSGAPGPSPAPAAAPTSPPASGPNASRLTTYEAQTPNPSTFVPGPATKHAGCKNHGPLPDAACTPGAVMTRDLDVICHHATRDRRRVQASVHRLAYTEYGYAYPQAHGAFEVDHLIPLELGGDNAIENLWVRREAKEEPMT